MSSASASGIARAMLRKSPVLIMDEPTSGLDAESERLVFEALERLLAGRTTFVIAHNLSTVRRADIILVLDAGAIVERGTHDDLIAMGGLYAGLWGSAATRAGGDRSSRRTSLGKALRLAMVPQGVARCRGKRVTRET